MVLVRYIMKGGFFLEQRAFKKNRSIIQTKNRLNYYTNYKEVLNIMKNEHNKITELLQNLPELEVPDGLHYEAMRNIRANEMQAKRYKRRLVFGLVANIGASAAVFLVFFLLFNTLNGNYSSDLEPLSLRGTEPVVQNDSFAVPFAMVDEALQCDINFEQEDLAGMGLVTRDYWAFNPVIHHSITIEAFSESSFDEFTTISWNSVNSFDGYGMQSLFGELYFSFDEEEELYNFLKSLGIVRFLHRPSPNHIFFEIDEDTLNVMFATIEIFDR